MKIIVQSSQILTLFSLVKFSFFPTTALAKLNVVLGQPKNAEVIPIFVMILAFLQTLKILIPYTNTLKDFGSAQPLGMMGI